MQYITLEYFYDIFLLYLLHFPQLYPRDNFVDYCGLFASISYATFAQFVWLWAHFGSILALGLSLAFTTEATNQSINLFGTEFQKNTFFMGPTHVTVEN